MSYAKQTVYNLKCDSCGALCDDEAWFTDRNELELCCETSEWIVWGRKHYCPRCYTESEDGSIAIKADNANKRP